MSNGRKFQRDHVHHKMVAGHPPDGFFKRLWWKCRRYLGIR